MRIDIKRLKKLAFSQSGRDYGWYIKLDRTIIGELIDWKTESMFYDSYAVIPADNEKEHILKKQSNWNECKFKFRNKIISEYAPNAFSGDSIHYCNGVTNRIVMRALYLVPNSKIETMVFNMILFFYKIKRIFKGKRDE